MATWCPLPQWHLLGPMTALNGVLLIGWSTALDLRNAYGALFVTPKQQG